MAPSVSRIAPWLIATAIAGVAGCSTTQQTAARLRLNDARIRATQSSTLVHGRDRAIGVLGVSLVRGTLGSALIVRLINMGPRPVSDLPISVGLIDRNRRLYLNSAPGTDYFQTHIPAIARRATLTWVFTTARKLPSRPRLFAVVGLPSAPPPSVPRTLPDLAARPRRGSAALRGGELQVSVQNLSSVPQYQLPVYFTASRGGRYVAAGEATIAQLDGGANTSVRLRLAGDPNGASISIELPPTIFN